MKNVDYKVQLHDLLNLNESRQWSLLLYVYMTGVAPPLSFPSSVVVTRDEVEELLLRMLLLLFSCCLVNKHQVFNISPNPSFLSATIYS
jgi:hypothetical protein